MSDGAAGGGAGEATDRLWVPLLSHYREGGGGAVIDPDRIAAHVRAIRPSVRQFLLAGSTGDGWELDRAGLEALLDLSRRADPFAGTQLLFGALRATTEAVVEQAAAIEAALARAPASGRFLGLAVCPPILADASQEVILAHYRAVLEATRGPIAVYQLPQVTRCMIAPETMRILAREERVTMFKDTSGTDTVAQAGVAGVTLVRGAEGGYVEALQPIGRYDGWLLSTGNGFGPVLRRILDRLAAGETARARRVSATLSAVVEALFAEAAPLPFGNAFSNANRAVDHLWAHGRAWRDASPPLTVSGNRLPLALLEAAEDLLGHFPALPARGYLAAA